MKKNPIEIGTFVHPSCWPTGARLLPGLPGVCPFFLPAPPDRNDETKSLPVEVEMSSTWPETRWGTFHYRVRITFLHSGLVSAGWVPVENF